MRDFSRIMVLVFTILLVAACGQAQVTPSNTPAPTASPIPSATPAPTPITVEELTSAEPAFVRFINTAPNSKTLNVFLGFSTIATNLAYTQYTESTQVDSGEYDLKILPSGSRQEDPALLETKLKVNGGEQILVLIVEKDNQLLLTILPEILEALNAGESIVTAISATTDGSTAILRNGDSDITVPLNSGDQVTTPILATDSKPQLAFQIGNGTINFDEDLKERQNYTLIAVGTAAQPAIIAFRTTAPGRVAVRALNAAKDIPTIDVYLGEKLLTSSAGYGRQTDRQSFASGEYTVLVYVAGSDRKVVQPLLNRVVKLDDSENITLILIGSANDLNLMAYPENLAATAPNTAQLTFLNTLPDVETVIVHAVIGSIGGEQRITYGQMPTLLSVEAGKYSFAMAGVQGLNPATTVELAENVQLEAGTNYLYLITGQQDNQPIILNEVVNIDTTLGRDDSPDQVARANPAQVRFINAVAEENLDLYSNGAVLVKGQAYGAGSELVDVADKHPTLDIRSTGSETSLAETEGAFEVGDSVTVIAFKTGDNSTGLLVIADNSLVFDGSSPHLRLINVSGFQETKLGLAFAEPGPTPPPPAASSESATEDVNSEPLTLPYGLQTLVTDVAATTASGSILMPVGVFDLQIINSQRNEIVATIAAQSLEAGVHTDIIAYQITEGGNIQAFAIQYPRPA